MVSQVSKLRVAACSIVLAMGACSLDRSPIVGFATNENVPSASGVSAMPAGSLGSAGVGSAAQGAGSAADDPPLPNAEATQDGVAADRSGSAASAGGGMPQDDQTPDTTSFADAASVEPPPSDGGTSAGPDAAMAPEPEPEPTYRFESSCTLNSDCAADEVCILSGFPSAVSYCGQSCTTNEDCQPGPPGAPQPICNAPLPGLATGSCRLPCDAVFNEACPVGMVCQDPVPALPANTGTCGFSG